MMRDNILILREAVSNLLGNKCYKCGSSKKLCLHHKDGNWKNNSKKNLRLLCVYCHMNGHGADWQKEYYALNNIKLFKTDFNRKEPYIRKCLKCGKVIIATTPKQMHWNYNVHAKTHIKEKSESERRKK